MITATPWRPALADAASRPPQEPIQRLNNAPLAAMKSGVSTSFDRRDRVLEPVIDQVFNFDAVLKASIWVSWVTMRNAQKTESAAVPRCYAVSGSNLNFDSYDGQKFEVLPAVRPAGNGEVIVQTPLIRTDHSPVKLDHVVRQGARDGRWWMR